MRKKEGVKTNVWIKEMLKSAPVAFSYMAWLQRWLPVK